MPTPQDDNDVVTLNSGGRMKLTKRMSINAEYNYLRGKPIVSTAIYNSLSLGLDMETGDHVFQFVFTNSDGMAAPYYLGKTAGSWRKGDIYFGFHIFRVFNLKKD